MISLAVSHTSYGTISDVLTRAQVPQDLKSRLVRESTQVNEKRKSAIQHLANERVKKLKLRNHGKLYVDRGRPATMGKNQIALTDIPPLSTNINELTKHLDKKSYEDASKKLQLIDREKATHSAKLQINNGKRHQLNQPRKQLQPNVVKTNDKQDDITLVEKDVMISHHFHGSQRIISFTAHDVRFSTKVEKSSKDFQALQVHLQGAEQALKMHFAHEKKVMSNKDQIIGRLD